MVIPGVSLAGSSRRFWGRGRLANRQGSHDVPCIDRNRPTIQEGGRCPACELEMPKRKRIPEKTERAVLIASRRRCCLCLFLENDQGVKQGQIAHIDRNRANNGLANLAFLCLPHHDEYDTKRSQSKGLQASELRHYRDLLISAWATGKSLAATSAEAADLRVLRGVRDHALTMLRQLPEKKRLMSKEVFDRHLISVFVNAGNGLRRARTAGAFDDHVDLLNILDGAENCEHGWETKNAAFDQFQAFWYWTKSKGAPDFSKRGDYRPFALRRFIGLLDQEISKRAPGTRKRDRVKRR